VKNCFQSLCFQFNVYRYSAGHLFDTEGWDLAVGALAGVMHDTLPDVRTLVVGAGGGAEGESPASSAFANSGGGRMTVEMEAAMILGSHPSTWLRASREALVYAATQRLLIQAAAELYFRHCARLGSDGLATLISALEASATHAGDIDADAELCRRLCRATAAAAAAVAEQPSLAEASGSSGSVRGLPDPPLIAMEVEASQAALAVLLHLHTAVGMYKWNPVDP
jgi:brefeldin A-inhibited guanine nucleotide-exchange protein